MRPLGRKAESGLGLVCFMDHVTILKRSAIMASVKTRNTGPERRVRSLIHRLGFRFRIHRSDLPGRPDVVLPRFKQAVFVHGCYWHGHACRYGRIPKSNVEYWRAKIRGNRKRDRLQLRKLTADGWDVLVVWQCELKDEASLIGKLAGFLGRSRTEAGCRDL